MREDFLLLNPGPVPLTRAVRDAMSEPMVSHRSEEFEAVYERAQDALDTVFERSTPGESLTSEGGTSLLLNGTATMGMEAAVANLVSSDSSVVAVINGKFGRRFKRIADRHASVMPVEFEWGEPVDVSRVASAVEESTDVVTMVHNETSTGLLNPVEAVGEIARDHDAWFVVDGVTSIGGDEFRMDDWSVDIAVTDGQKCLAGPPGISALYVTDRVLSGIDGENAPFYEDLDWHRRKAEDHQTPFTSAVPLFRGFATALEAVVEEGMNHRIERHRRQARAFREGFVSMGLDSFPRRNEESAYSNTVTAISLPEDIRGEKSGAFFDAVTERGVSISGGQAHLGGDIFRVSNMGNLRDQQILRGIRTVGESFESVGVDVDLQSGLDAARAVLE
ncbi:MAG: alanine--glyoxylate aminotransferase family protein [Halodesulfurarchaeum sp.]